MLPRLKAEERLNAINDGAISAATMEKADQRTIVTALQEEAGIVRPRAARAKAAELAIMGIGMTVIEPPSKEPLSDG